MGRRAFTQVPEARIQKVVEVGLPLTLGWSSGERLSHLLDGGNTVVRHGGCELMLDVLRYWGLGESTLELVGCAWWKSHDSGFK